MSHIDRRGDRAPILNARTLLLSMFGAGWLTVVIITAINNHGSVPNELWPVLGFGVGTILAAFRIDDFARKDKDVPAPVAPKPAAAKEGL